jgi:type VI secretion system secreted protein Hcp
MAAKDVKVFLLELKLQKQGVIKGDAAMVHGPLKFANGLQCHAFNYGVTSQFDAGSGQLVGRRIHEPFTIVREVDSASPLIWQALVTNESVVTATLSFARPQSSVGAGAASMGQGALVLHTVLAISGGAIVKYRTWHGVLPGGNEAVEQVSTNELEEFQIVFSKLQYSNMPNSKSAQDDWQKMS